MKTLYEFLALTTEEQFDYTWNCCKLLASRREEEKLLVNLYYGGGLFIEIWLDEQWNVVRIRPFTKYKVVESYLENICIDSLFE